MKTKLLKKLRSKANKHIRMCIDNGVINIYRVKKKHLFKEDEVEWLFDNLKFGYDPETAPLVLRILDLNKGIEILERARDEWVLDMVKKMKSKRDEYNSTWFSKCLVLGFIFVFALVLGRGFTPENNKSYFI
jgi:hypothetical protein